MAATLTPDGELTYFSFPIEKSEETADGDLIVYGKATDGSVDSDLQIVDQDWSAKAIQEWLDTGGNVRVQHQARRDPAGRGLAVECTSDGHFVKALVVEPVAKELVRKRVLQDFSVGISLPDINPDPTGKAMNGIITGRRDGLTKISEISLVDRGSNFNSKFQLVKAAGDGAPEFVGKMFGGMADFLTKTVNPDAKPERVDYPVGGIQLTLPDDVSVSFKPSDLAKILKRKMDPDVGGGTDRDTIPAADFAGNDRSFPIVTPQDVHDAASSIGRAGDDNVSSSTLKQNIIRIARRKGASFVARLPESWKKELGMADSTKDVDPEVGEPDIVDKSATEQAEQTEKSGVPPQFVKDKDDEDEKDGDDSSADKAAKPDDGGDKPDDDKDEEDQDTGEDAVADKSVDAVVEKVDGIAKKSKVMCPGCGANVHSEHNFCSECGGNLKGALAIKKNHDFTCLKCGMQLDKGEKFCPGCGKEHPGYLPEADSKAKAAGDDSEAAVAKAAKKAAKNAAADVVEPVIAVDEPTMAKMFVPGDMEASASMRLKMLGVPLDYGMLHDLTCPCFSAADVAKSYPRYDLSTLDANHWQQKAFDMAASAPLDQARMANQLWQAVILLKNTDPRDLAEVRSDLYKEFRDANPGPGSFSSPGAVHAGSFNRPLVTAGHEASSPGHGMPNSAPVSFNQISAAQYSRGYLDGGHAAESPSDAASVQRPVGAPTATGVPTRTYYTNAMKDNARQAMLAMHDHIAQTFPDLCPAHMSTVPGSRPIPSAVGKTKKAKKPAPAKPAVVVEESEVDKTIDTSKAATSPEIAKAAVVDMDAVQAMVTKAVADANAVHETEMTGLRKELKKARKQLDAIADQPDPNGPYRGVAFDQIQKAVAPEVLPSVSRVERTQEALFRHLHDEWRNSPDPMQREVAYRELCKMSGIGNTPIYK